MVSVVSLNLISCVPSVLSLKYILLLQYNKLLHYIILTTTVIYCDAKTTTVINGHLVDTLSYLVCYSSVHLVVFWENKMKEILFYLILGKISKRYYAMRETYKLTLNARFPYNVETDTVFFIMGMFY